MVNYGKDWKYYRASVELKIVLPSLINLFTHSRINNQF